MVRVKTSVSSRKRVKRVLKQTKGQFGHRSKRHQQAKRSLLKSLTYEFRDRKAKKRDFRRLWITRLNAACRELGITYSRFIKGLSTAKVEIDRKMLSELAINSPESFKKIVDLAKSNLVAAK